MPTARNLLASVLGPDGRIYAIGGWFAPNGPILASATVEAYDPTANAWASLPAMPTARYYLGAAAANGKLYAIGGGAATQPFLDKVEVYDSVANLWSPAHAMPTAREALAVVTGPDGKIYGIGGLNGTGPLSTVEVYDAAQDSWSTVAPMPTARYALAAAVGPDGRIYAIGGTDGNSPALSTVEAYDITADSWSAVSSLPTARRDLSAASSSGRIFAVGGDPQDGTISSAMEAYSPATDTWTVVASMPTGCDAPAAVTGADQRVYVLGGTCGTVGVFAAFSNGVQAYSPRWQPMPNGLEMPTSGTVTQPYSWSTTCHYDSLPVDCHDGADIWGGRGTDVVSVLDGVVVAAECQPEAYGWRVVVDHGTRTSDGNHLFTSYAHMGSPSLATAIDTCNEERPLLVSVGEHVAAGQALGTQGNSGNVTDMRGSPCDSPACGVHLHFSMNIAPGQGEFSGFIDPTRCIGTGPYLVRGLVGLGTCPLERPGSVPGTTGR